MPPVATTVKRSHHQRRPVPAFTEEMFRGFHGGRLLWLEAWLTSISSGFIFEKAIMNLKTALMVVGMVGIMAVAATLFAISYVAYGTFAYSGGKALERLAADEQSYWAKYDQLQAGMTYDQVVEIMGEPDRDALGLRATWRVNGSGLNQIAVYFQAGKLRKVRWLHLGRFVMEK